MSYKSRCEALARQLRALELASKQQRQAMRAALRAVDVGRAEAAAAVLRDALDGGVAAGGTS